MLKFVTITICAFVVCSTGVAAAGRAAPGNAIIVAMAQQFVLDHYPRSASRHFDLTFDLAQVHLQPEGDYWAGVGGFRADQGGNRYKSHFFVAAVRLVCDRYRSLACWQLEKLAINRTIFFDRGEKS